MGEMVPVKVRMPGSGYRLLWNLVLALVFLALVPFVAGAGLSLAATYFPGPTRALLGPALEKLGIGNDRGAEQKATEALEKAEAAEDRLAQLERDVASLMEKSASGSQPAVTSQVDSLVVPLRQEVAWRDRGLAGFTAITQARSELLAGNRGIAEKEVALALDCLRSDPEAEATRLPEDVFQALTKALEAIRSDSPAAGDYLSLAWHLLADALMSLK